MTKNPLYNACAAFVYIIGISAFLRNAQTIFGKGPDMLMSPIIILSLFVFSAATMAYIFLYQPVLLFLDGHKQEATNLFLKTVGSFGGMTFVMVVVWAMLIRSV